MANRFVPDAQTASDMRFNQLTVTRFRSDASAATGHALFRNELIAKVLCYVGMLRSTDRISSVATVQCSAAILQHFNSPDGYQAAHYLPGQILIDGKLPWLFINDAHSRSQFENQFAEVEHLPPNFNKADSISESLGLKVAFARSCQDVVRRHGQPPKGRLNRQAIRDAYNQTWCPAAISAFEAAIQQKESRPKLPSIQKDERGNILNLAERGNSDQSGWCIDEQLNVLHHYLNSMRIQPPALSDSKMNEFERDFRS